MLSYLFLIPKMILWTPPDQEDHSRTANLAWKPEFYDHLHVFDIFIFYAHVFHKSCGSGGGNLLFVFLGSRSLLIKKILGVSLAVRKKTFTSCTNMSLSPVKWCLLLSNYASMIMHAAVCARMLCCVYIAPMEGAEAPMEDKGYYVANEHPSVNRGLVIRWHHSCLIHFILSCWWNIHF